MVARMGQMSGFAEPWGPGFDPAHGILVLPLWSAAVCAALFAAYWVLVLARAGRDGVGQAFSRAGLLLIGGAVAWAVLDATSAGMFADQRRALDARLLEMSTRALMPGSPLACLDATAGELVEASCEKALFASPEAVAASVAYVSAQLSFLADASEYEHRSGANYEIGAGRPAPRDRDRPFRHRGACAGRPRWLHARSMRRVRIAARYRPGERKSERAQIRGHRPASRQRVAAIGALHGGVQPACAGAGSSPRRRRSRPRRMRPLWLPPRRLRPGRRPTASSSRRRPQFRR